MQQRFKHIAITGKPDDAGTSETIEGIVRYLHARGLAITIDAAVNPPPVLPKDCRIASVEELIDGADMVISVGGDGTLLHAGRLVAEHNIPVLGVNRGRLGFLVDVPPHDLAGLDAVLAGEFIEEDRVLLQAELHQNGKVLKTCTALNDVVLYKWNTARMVEFTTYIDGQLLTTHRADGIIIATPTGSTAYALAGGGPIIHPSVDAIALVPVCPHTLSNRPLVIGANSVIEVEVADDDIDRIGVSCDGLDDLGLQAGSRLVIRRHQHYVRLIHPPQYRYYDILRAKLRWGDTNLR